MPDRRSLLRALLLLGPLLFALVFLSVAHTHAQFHLERRQADSFNQTSEP